MEVRLSISVIHAPWDANRRSFVNDMVRVMGGMANIHKECANFVVQKDYNRSGCWPNARRCWMNGLASRSTHHLVLSDDALPCRNFIPAVKEMISHKPDEVITLWSMRGIVLEAAKQGSSWYTTNEGAMGLANLMPVGRVAEFLQWEKANVLPACPHDDTRIAAFARSLGKKIWHPCPNLCEHRAPNDSLLGYSDRRKVSKLFIGLDKDPMDIDWTKGLPNPPHGGGSTTTLNKWLRS